MKLIYTLFFCMITAFLLASCMPGKLEYSLFMFSNDIHPTQPFPPVRMQGKVVGEFSRYVSGDDNSDVLLELHIKNEFRIPRKYNIVCSEDSEGNTVIDISPDAGASEEQVLHDNDTVYATYIPRGRLMSNQARAELLHRLKSFKRTEDSLARRDSLYQAHAPQ